MTIHDDGRSFQVDKVSRPRGGKRLGLIGMRERLEMIGGTFAVGSTAGKGTTITAQVPAAKPTRTPARSLISKNLLQLTPSAAQRQC